MPIRTKIAVVLLAFGAFAGFASGFAHVGHGRGECSPHSRYDEGGYWGRDGARTAPHPREIHIHVD